MRIQRCLYGAKGEDDQVIADCTNSYPVSA